MRALGIPSEAELARRAGLTTSNNINQVLNLTRDLSAGLARSLAPVLRIAVEDLLRGERRLIPLEWRVGGFEAETGEKPGRLAEPRWVDPRRPLAGSLRDWFAAEVQTEGLPWKRGAWLIVQRIGTATLRHSSRVLACDRTTGDVLPGRLIASDAGEISVQTSALRPLPWAIAVRRARPGADLCEPAIRWHDDPIDYMPQPGDDGDLLGLIEDDLPPPRLHPLPKAARRMPAVVFLILSLLLAAASHADDKGAAIRGGLATAAACHRRAGDDIEASFGCVNAAAHTAGGARRVGLYFYEWQMWHQVALNLTASAGAGSLPQKVALRLALAGFTLFRESLGAGGLTLDQVCRGTGVDCIRLTLFYSTYSQVADAAATAASPER